jgi:hypothetical protein
MLSQNAQYTLLEDDVEDLHGELTRARDSISKLERKV